MFKKEFERRLIRLDKAIVEYFATVKIGSLFLRLFSVYSYLWTSDNAVKKR